MWVKCLVIDKPSAWMTSWSKWRHTVTNNLTSLWFSLRPSSLSLNRINSFSNAKWLKRSTLFSQKTNLSHLLSLHLKVTLTTKANCTILQVLLQTPLSQTQWKSRKSPWIHWVSAFGIWGAQCTPWSNRLWEKYRKGMRECWLSCLMGSLSKLSACKMTWSNLIITTSNFRIKVLSSRSSSERVNRTTKWGFSKSALTPNKMTI